MAPTRDAYNRCGRRDEAKARMEDKAIAGAQSEKGGIAILSGVKKTYDGINYAVKNLDLTIKRGEFLKLLGPSGSGKTTTLMMLAGFEDPTEGHIILNGRAIERVPPYRRNIGMVFQQYALFPHMTAEENIAFPLRARHFPKAEIGERVRRSLDLVCLPDLGRRMPNELSGGQQQRIALARAIVFGPEIVLMDEPLGALDKQLREQMQLEIRRLHRDLGVTVIYVTHDQSEALTMSDRIAVFDKGAIQQLDLPAKIYESPRTTFVATFLGENNLIPGRVVGPEGRFWRVALASGDIVAGVSDTPPEVGAMVLISIRPERLLVAEAAKALVNHFTGEVREAYYLGDHLRLRVICFNDREITVKLPPRDTALPAVGDRISIGWAPDHSRILPE